MSAEPERPIEKLLHAAAQRRREEAGRAFELHPADRGILQREVARTYQGAPAAHPSFFRQLLHLLPRFSGGLALLAVLALTAWLLLPPPGPGPSQLKLAQNPARTEAATESVRLASAPPPAAASPAAPAPALNASERSLKESAPAPSGFDADRLAYGGARQKNDQPAVAAAPVSPAPAAPPQPATFAANSAATLPYAYSAPAAAPTSASATKPTFGIAHPPAGAPQVALAEKEKRSPAPVEQPLFAAREQAAAPQANRFKSADAAANSLGTGLADSIKDSSARAISQQFRRVAAETKAKRTPADRTRPAQPVLAAFRLEQDGNRLRVVDSDGSVYRGTLEIVAAGQRAPSPGSESAATGRASETLDTLSGERSAPRLGLDQTLPQTYYFRVTGTNRTVRKPVVFTGNLLPVTNLITSGLGGARDSNSPLTDGISGQVSPSNPRPLLRSRIQGKAVIGQAKPIDINALPATR